MQADHLLLVEDDLLILATMARGLRAAGFQVSNCSSGEEALELCQHSHPDLGILDIRLPGISGLELSTRLAELQIPFLFLSAHDDEAFVCQAEQAGALGYLIKPTDVPQLIPSIRTALARARELSGIRQQGQQLLAALQDSREISTAVGLLMAQLQLGEKQAFDQLRKEARRRQMKVVDLARALIARENP